MPLYLASYDITEKDRDEYQELWDYFDSLGGVKILYSQYAVPFAGRALELAEKIRRYHLKSGDRLLVCELFDGPGGTCAASELKNAIQLRIGSSISVTLTEVSGHRKCVVSLYRPPAERHQFHGFCLCMFSTWRAGPYASITHCSAW